MASFRSRAAVASIPRSFSARHAEAAGLPDGAAGRSSAARSTQAAQPAHRRVSIFPWLRARQRGRCCRFRHPEPEPFPAVSSYFRDLVFNDPKLGLPDLRLRQGRRSCTTGARRHARRTAEGSRQAISPVGASCSLSHGWADPLIPPMSHASSSTTSWRAARPREVGQNRDARLFMTP